MSIVPVIGPPGMQAIRTSSHRLVFKSKHGEMYLPGGRIIDGTKSADPGNTGAVRRLRAGLLMGKITSGGKFAPSVFGTLTNAEANGSTQLETSAAAITEILRRVGATGSVKVTGPPTAAGTVRSITASYSAGSGTNLTITAMSVNEVQTISFGAAATAGTVKLGFTLASGAVVWTDTAAWSATDATFLSNINAAIDNLLGAGLVVATAIPATDTDLGFVLTFSGAGYTALPQSLVQVDASALTSVTTVTVTRTTTGVDGRFVAGSLIQPTDGSETILSFLPDGWPIQVADSDGTGVDIDYPMVPVGGIVYSDQLIGWPSDTSLRAYIVAALQAAGSGYAFDHTFAA